MLKHSDVWAGIDRLAKAKDLSASGLARIAGLDPTTFNKSKRITKEGKLRWPSTESVSKVLDATSTSLTEFVQLIRDDHEEATAPRRRIRCCQLGQLGRAEAFDAAGYPSGSGWEEIDFPGIEDPAAYAIEIQGDALSPAYRDGDLVIVSPSASIRRQDRVVAMRKDGSAMVGVLLRRTVQRVVVNPVAGSGAEVEIPTGDLRWLARIVIASQ